ncbi:MAG: c-type cytochrome, partial [Bacteroidota bacterium]
LPEKFGAVVVADDLGRGRHLAIRENGDIYVHLRKHTEDSTTIVALRDTSGDGRADVQQGFSSIVGTGIEIHKNHLYYSDKTKVYRSPFNADELVPANKTEVVAELVEGGGHMEKPFTFDQAGNMYVNVGSQTNACQETPRTKASPGVDPCVELETRAGIWKFSDSELNQQQDLSKRYATGIRNANALVWNDHTNSLFFATHGRDDLHRFWPEYFTEDENVHLPAEELHEATEAGQDFGWPYCYFNQFEGKRFLNPEYGGDGKKTERCEGQPKPVITFPGHWGPNDILIYKGDQFPERYKHGIFVAFHGSWNRLGHFQAGYKVVFVPYENGRYSSNYEIFADAFVGTKPIRSTNEARFRPCGLAEGPDGSLYILDSQKGRLWRINYHPEGLPVPVKPIEMEMASLDESAEPPAIPAELEAGHKVYTTYCLACHQANGKGAPGMNPPLAGTDWVTGDKTRLINVILNGLSEPVEINGELYQNQMASHAFLTDQQIADVLSYIRKSFGNEASAITPEEVAERRAAL